jgi:RNA polymerase primary sigma factor
MQIQGCFRSFSLFSFFLQNFRILARFLLIKEYPAIQNGFMADTSKDQEAFMTAIKETKTKTDAKKMKKNLSAGEDSLSMYLHEIGSIPLMSREEEDEAARAAASGNAKAREQLINRNLRFVVRVAKKYQGQGLSLDDLVSEGNVGLIYAADHFDVNKGYRFITYAVWWIRHAINRAICEKSRMIRLPANRNAELIQIKKARKIMAEDRIGGEDMREIAALLDLDKNLVEELLLVSREMVSLEHPASPDRDASMLKDCIEDEQNNTPEQEAVQHALEHDLKNVLDSLGKKEADIIRYRYGLGKNFPMSLQEIGDQFNLTKERVRQIEEKALLRLQHVSRCQKLSAYVA